MTPISATQGKTKDNNEETFAAAHAVDKDLYTVAGVQTDNGLGWLKIEFDRTYFINKIKIHYLFYTNWYNPSGWCAKSVENFKKCVNRDNNIDVSVYQGEVQRKSCGTLQLTYGLEQSDQIYTLPCNVRGDTVKLNKRSGLIFITEVVVTSDGEYKLSYPFDTSTF